MLYKRVILLLLLAMSTELVPSSQGQFFVGAPNGSPPVPRNVCQKATLNLIQSCGHEKTCRTRKAISKCQEYLKKRERERKGEGKSENQPSSSSLESPLLRYTI